MTRTLQPLQYINTSSKPFLLVSKMSKTLPMSFTPTKTFQGNTQQYPTTIFPPPYKPNKDKKNSKCLVYFVFFLVLLTLSFLVFASVIKIKHPTLTIKSINIESLNYNFSKPSFNITTHMIISLKNHNFGHLELDPLSNNMTIIMIYENATVVGSSELKFRTGRIAARGEEEIHVEMMLSSSHNNGLILDDHINKKLKSDLNIGYLEFMSYSMLKGKVHLLKKLKFHTIALMNCTIDVDLRRELVQELVC